MSLVDTANKLRDLVQKPREDDVQKVIGKIEQALGGAATAYLTGGVVGGALQSMGNAGQVIKQGMDVANAVKNPAGAVASAGANSVMDAAGVPKIEAPTPSSSPTGASMDWGNFIGNVGQNLQPNRSNVLNAVKTGVDVGSSGTNMSPSDVISYGIKQGSAMPIQKAEQQATLEQGQTLAAKTGAKQKGFSITKDGNVSMNFETPQSLSDLGAIYGLTEDQAKRRLTISTNQYGGISATMKPLTRDTMTDAGQELYGKALVSAKGSTSARAKALSDVNASKIPQDEKDYIISAIPATPKPSAKKTGGAFSSYVAGKGAGAGKNSLGLTPPK